MPLHPWLNLTDYSTIQLIPAFIGSLSWVIVYLLLIRNARRYHFVEMPFFIACGNIAWEFLYGFIFCQYVNMGQLFIWGNRVWFFLDVYIVFVLIFRYGPKQVATPLIRQFFKPIVIGTVIAFTALFYGLVASGLDNAPLWSSGLVRLGGISAYLLNIGISTLYIALYLRAYQTEVFSRATAWLKMIGTVGFTIFFWQIDPHNTFLHILAIIVFLLDGSYITLQYLLPNVLLPNDFLPIAQTTLSAASNEATILTDSEGNSYCFPLNPAFEAAWNAMEVKEYHELQGVQLRKILKPEWVVDMPNYFDTHSVLEGANIILHTQSGFGTGEATNAICNVMMDIIRTMNLEEHPHIVLTDTLGSAGANADARRRTIEFFREMAHLPQSRVVIANTMSRIALKLIQPFSSMIRSWRIYDTMARASSDILARFAASGITAQAPTPENSGRWTVQPDEQHPDNHSALYHQQRLQQLYSGLAKISDNDLDGFQGAEVPATDIYHDVFTALEVIAREKRAQIAALHEVNHALADSNEEILRQQQILVEQSRDIELANSMLQEQNERLAHLNAELSEANRFKTQILSIAAHDLKNPLGAILGMTQMLQMSIPDTEPTHSWLASIQGTVDRMSKLIKDLLDSAAMELGNVSLRRSEFSLTLLAAGMVERYAPKAEQKNQRIELEITESIMYQGDQDRMEQVLDNIISNALKYSPHNAIITVRTKQTATTARVEVQDQGPGISEEDQQKMFGFFQRLSAQPTGGESSNGVGLAIVKKIIDIHGGKIWCDSELGKGTTFIIELPL